MATKKKKGGVRSVTKVAVSTEIAARGIHTSDDYCNMMSAMMSDLVAGAMSPQIARAVVGAGNSLIRMTRTQLEFGRNNDGTSVPIRLTGQRRLGNRGTQEALAQ